MFTPESRPGFLIEVVLNTQANLGRQECGLSLHLLKPSLTRLSSVLSFQYTSLALLSLAFVPKRLVIPHAVVKGIAFSISLSECSLLARGNTAAFCVLI